MKKYDVFWVRGGRVGSVVRGEGDSLIRSGRCVLIQEDTTGTRHWRIMVRP